MLAGMKTEGNIAAIRYNLGNRIRMLREDQELSQYRFAEMIQTDRSYIIGVEKGRRNLTVDKLIQIAQGLGIPLSDLCKDVDNEESIRERLQIMESQKAKEASSEDSQTEQ